MKYLLKDSLPATQARTQFFNLVDAAYHAGHTTKIMKNGVVVATVSPYKPKKVDWAKKIKELEAMEPFLTDEDVKAYEEIREKSKKSRFPEW